MSEQRGRNAAKGVSSVFLELQPHESGKKIATQPYKSNKKAQHFSVLQP
jgi:hypothetical protein